MMVAINAARPFARVADRCLPRPIASMNTGSVVRISAALRPEYTRSVSATNPETIDESLIA